MQNSSKSSKRKISSQNNAALGGEARTRNFADQPELLKMWSSWGGKATLDKYGPGHFAAIRKLRESYPRKQVFPGLSEIRRSIAGKVNGRKGGIVRANLYGEDFRREWGRLGGIATRNRYGSEFFRAIRERRVTYKKSGYINRRTKIRLHKEALENLKTVRGPLREMWKVIERQWRG